MSLSLSGAPEATSLGDTGAVVVAHDRIEYAAACVRSLRRWLAPSHIALVLNVPGQADPRTVADFNNVAVVSPRSPQGYGANLNLGVRTLSDDLRFVVLANDDVDFSSDSLPRLIAHLQSDARIAVVGAALRDAAGTPQTSARPFPDALYALLTSAVPSRPIAPLERISQHRWDHRQIGGREQLATQPTDVDWVIGAAMAVRLAAFNEVTGFDEDFRLYFEETDFCYRLQRRGWRVVHVPDAVVVHLQGRSTVGARYDQLLEEGCRRFIAKRLGRIRWLVLEVVLVVTFVGTALWSLAGGIVRPAMFGQRWLLVASRWRNRMFWRSSQ